MNAYNYKQVAADYDDLAKQHQWQAPELLFNYLSGFVRKGTKLLDVGVGTGISSERFHSKQVELYGLDNSSDLLSICDAKSLFKELHLLDILKGEVPYPDETFDYVVCIGVLHFFSNLDEVFAKINRVLKYHGFFAFTFIENGKTDTPYITKITDGINLK